MKIGPFKFSKSEMALIVVMILMAAFKVTNPNLFVKPPLVEGPKILFYIPVPSGLPFAMENGWPVTITVATTWFIMALFYSLFHFGMRDLKIAPSRLQAVLEGLYGILEAIVAQTLGKWKKKYLAYIGTLICFILVSNIIGFFPIPGFSVENGILTVSPLFRAPTADINTTLGLALITTYAFMAAAFKTGGPVGYIKGLMEPTPVMLPINIVGEFAKPTNISMRLFGNMFAGMVIMGLLYKALPAAIPSGLSLYFDLFSGLVQSFVFTMLTMVYIQGSLGDAEPELD